MTQQDDRRRHDDDPGRDGTGGKDDEGRKDDGKDGQDDREPPQREPQGVWLVVRYDLADHGHRPVPPGDVFWTSPDIWVTGGTDLGTIVDGRPFTPHARVWNLGTFPAVNVRVQFAVLDPVMGAATPQPVGTAWIPYLGGLSTAAVASPETWTHESDGAGHPCLFAKASVSPFDEAPVGWDSYHDRHTGQRNLTVVPTGSGPVPLRLSTTLVLGEGTPRFAATAVVARRTEDLLRPGRAALRHALTALEQTRDPAPALRRRVAALTAALDEAPEVTEIDARELVHVRGIDGPVPPLPARRATYAEPAALGRLPGTGKQTRLDVKVDPPHVDGDVAVHLWQLEGGVPTGGYTVLVTDRKEIDLAATGTRTAGGLHDQVTGPTDRSDQDEGAAAPPRTKGAPDMKDEDAEKDDGRDATIDALVVDQFPAVRVTRDVVRQLAHLLPLRGPDELRRALEQSAVVVEGEKLDLAGTVDLIPEQAFPVEDVRDLVAKVAAGVRIGAQAAAQGRFGSRSEHLTRIALDVAAQPAGGGGGIPAGHFVGPSVFGYEKEA